MYATISVILFFSSGVMNSAHPCLPIVAEFLKTRNVARIVAEYAEEDTIVQTKSKKYYACAFPCGWIQAGRVVIYDDWGNEIRRFKANYPKAITFSPSGDSIIIMHIRRNPDPGLLFTGYLSYVVEVKVFSLEDGHSTADYPSTRSGWAINAYSIEGWPDMSAACIKKFCVDEKGTLRVECTVGGNSNERVLMQQMFMQTSNKELQKSRDNATWWKEKFLPCKRRFLKRAPIQS